MTTNAKANAGFTTKFHTIFKPRDLFLHDGKSLRRFTIGVRFQMAVVMAAFALLAWSSFATFQAISAMNGDVAQMERQIAQMQADVAAIRNEARQRAAALERRQAFLATMLSGDADAERLAALLPAAASESDNPATRAVSQTFANVEGMQAEFVDQVQAAARQRYRRTAGALRQLGFNPARFHGGGAAVGGPYEPVPTVENADPRFRELFTTWRQLDQLEHGVAAIPSAMPLHNNANFTSGFGIRSDPFRGRAAMHAGIDLAGPSGTPIYATADGIVGRSEWNNGGYGNLVEIDHGQGIQTRYGHLSQRIAQPGQRVRRGEVIGLMGSTGRSTGSHLHYEVRIDGRAVNPVPFMQSSNTFMALQQQPVAIGGPAGGSR
ncbi:MAG TPA: M23 family metallopeptidase [Allosphingosinicella sp.]|nr:M23 family metallopeptidase [Allosphingosinicella sp.]